MNKFVLSIIMAVCFAAGCDVKAQVSKETRSSLRAYASTQLAKTVITNPVIDDKDEDCLLYTSPSPRDKRQSRMPSSA